MKRISLKTIALALGMGCCGAALAAQTLVRDVRVFDGERMLARRSVLIDGARIVDPDFHGALPAGARVVDGAGRTLLPGLIDAHVHAYRFFDLPLMFGVTTQIDMFTGVAVMQEITRKMKSGQNQGQADMFSAGTLATAPGGHGTEYGMPIPTLGAPAEAQAFVDARIAEGSFFIKIVLESGNDKHPLHSLDLATVKALVAAAHLRGKLAVAHISTLADARGALEAGVDGLVHLFVGGQIDPAELASLVALAQSSHAFVIPTFSVMESIAGLKADDILADASLAGLLDKEQTQPLRASYGPVPRPALMTAPNTLTAALSKAGVRILAGTDAGNTGTQYGISLHHEMASLVQAGLTPVEALAAATSAPARAFGLRERGRILKGYKADLLLVEGDPGADIASTRRIVEVWKDGEPLSALRSARRAQVAAERAAPAQERVQLPADGRISLFANGQLGSPVGIGWVPSNDAFLGGKSTVSLTLQEAEANAQPALAVEANVAPGFPYPWAGLAFMPGKQPMQPANLSGTKVIRFKVRGDGKAYNVAVMSSGVTIPVNVGFVAAGEWKEVAIPFSEFKGIDAGAVTMIAFNAGPRVGAYSFQIADVRLVNE
ncbi:MAG: CIA30 family protein [Pseudomonadota bacterium]